MQHAAAAATGRTSSVAICVSSLAVTIPESTLLSLLLPLYVSCVQDIFCCQHFYNSKSGSSRAIFLVCSGVLDISCCKLPELFSNFNMLIIFNFCYLLFAAVLPTMPQLSLGNIFSIHVHSAQTIPASAFPRSRLPGVPYQAANLHEACSVPLHLRERQSKVPVVPPDTGYPRASFRNNGGGVCPSVTDVCSQPFFVSFEVSILRHFVSTPGQELPILHVSQQLMHSSEPNIAFFDDPPVGQSTLVSPRILSNNRPAVQALQYSLKTMTSGCGSLQLQLHFVTDGHLEHTTEEFVMSIPTWGKEVLDFHLLQETATASPSPFFDLSMHLSPCRPVDWDVIEHLSDHRALVAAVELPSPFAITFVPMMAVPPFESRSTQPRAHHFPPSFFFLASRSFLFQESPHSRPFLHNLFSHAFFRAVARFWSDMSVSEQDSGGSFVGDQIYATGLYRSVYCRKISVLFMCMLNLAFISPTETSLFLFILRERFGLFSRKIFTCLHIFFFNVVTDQVQMLRAVA
jgi:hypothetical protein